MIAKNYDSKKMSCDDVNQIAMHMDIDQFRDLEANILLPKKSHLFT